MLSGSFPFRQFIRASEQSNSALDIISILDAKTAPTTSRRIMMRLRETRGDQLVPNTLRKRYIYSISSRAFGAEDHRFVRLMLMGARPYHRRRAASLGTSPQTWPLFVAPKPPRDLDSTQNLPSITQKWYGTLTSRSLVIKRNSRTNIIRSIPFSHRCPSRGAVRSRAFA
jgi:hypothetical protein